MKLKWPWITNKDLEPLVWNIKALQDQVTKLSVQINKIQTIASAHNEAIGRVLAVTHKNLGISEFDEERKAESGRIGSEAIKRLIAEQQVRDDKGYTP